MTIDEGPIKHVPPPWDLKGTSYLFMFWIPSSQAKSLPTDIAFSPLEAQSSFASAANSGSPQGGIATIQIHRYESSPAGPYDEFILSTGMYTYPVEENEMRKEKKNMRITRIYVSQKTACWNGRKDWNTPKHLARFEFNELPGGATEIKIFPHDTTGDQREAAADIKPFFSTIYSPIRYMPSFPLTTSLVKLLGIDFTVVQPPVPAAEGSQGELVGSDRWCSFYPTLSSSQTEAGWFDMSQKGNTGEENFWPGLGRWRLGMRMKNAEISFKDMRHWETPRSTQ
ncbi:uncharacterized protein CTRU02_203230 [Colletotrichum truncatum]|uniref:Uncharacterized protein n=1 Tax=Colletotrichum truncatum TaxID=5467 RepID=A0ACC3Z8R3_COLTU|nr:uncharacterized protein CTRU02_09069 [Colletotrichum truncatum]KAF6789277.1 hypothetical protein CTRU02_09069 [Colletotrichum truncatum]